MSVSKAIDLAMALNEPDLVQAVREFSRNTSVLTARGMDTTSADLIRKSAADALSRTVDGP